MRANCLFLVPIDLNGIYHFSMTIQVSTVKIKRMTYTVSTRRCGCGIMWMGLLVLVSRQVVAFTPSRLSLTVMRPSYLVVAFSTATEELEASIKAKGDEIRIAKNGGADKTSLAPLVAELLTLKAQLNPTAAPAAPAVSNIPKQAKKEQSRQTKQKTDSDSDNDDDDSDSDFITSREENYSKWYNDIIRVTGLAESSPVRGCMVIKPWGMSIWDRIRTDLDATIQEHGAENAYFPLLIPKSFLSKEAEHVDGFAKECAVVTHHRLTAGENGLIADPDAELEDPLIIRPTSETMIWYMFRKWINSYR